MSFEPGLVHTPLTPFAEKGRIDFDCYGTLLDFHVRNGADALAVPMHAGESVSLSDDEKRALIRFAVERVGARAPVIAHVSDAGTGIAAALARFAQEAGAAAIVTTTPYYWTPPPAMIVEHFTQIGSAVTIPLFVFNAPEDMAGSKINAAGALKLVERLPNFAGVVDDSLDWQFMIELLTDVAPVRPNFMLLAGSELLVSAAAIGAKGVFSALTVIAPKLVRRLFDLCRAQKLFEARTLQEDAAALRQILKPGGIASLKAATHIMGRGCGPPRAPLLPFDGEAENRLAVQLGALSMLAEEPFGW